MKITIKDLLDNAVHYGHRNNKWNPKMKPFIYGEVNGIHLFNLEKTLTHLEELLQFLKNAVENNKNILFCSTKPQTQDIIPRVAATHNFPYVTEKWFGGLLTNFNTMKERIRYFKNLKEQETTGEFDKFTKKEAAEFRKEINKLETALGGISNMRKVPQVLFVVDGKRDLIAIKEAKKLNITVVGICDSNADPDLYDIFVPANDDAMKSLEFIMGLVEETLKSSQTKPQTAPVLNKGAKKSEKPAQTEEKPASSEKTEA